MDEVEADALYAFAEYQHDYDNDFITEGNRISYTVNGSSAEYTVSYTNPVSAGETYTITVGSVTGDFKAS